MTNHRLGRGAAEHLWRGIRGGVAAVESVGPGDLEGMGNRGELIGSNFSIVDRTSFAVMQRLGLDRVAPFDTHFAVYRYGPRRQRAFVLVN